MNESAAHGSERKRFVWMSEKVHLRKDERKADERERERWRERERERAKERER